MSKCPGDSAWRLAIRLEVLSGATLVERFECARQAGFDAVELPGRVLSEYCDELLDSLGRLPLPVSSISLGYRHSLLSREPEHRQICRADVTELFRLCRTVDASGLVMPPLLSKMCPDSYAPNGPGLASRDARDELLTEQLMALAPLAAAQNVELWIEPVNHDETDYMTTLDHAARIARRVNHPAIGIVADVYHMHIDESDPAAALRAAGDQIRHVHVGHTDRTEARHDTPLLGETLTALRDFSYRGYIVVEARHLSAVPETSLPRCANLLRFARHDPIF